MFWSKNLVKKKMDKLPTAAILAVGTIVTWRRANGNDPTGHQT